MGYRRLNINLPNDLFARVKLLAKYYHVPMSKVMIQLLEIGYIKTLEDNVGNNLKT